VLAGVSPNMMQSALLGDRQAHFKWFFHEARPGWRLTDGRGNNTFMKDEKYRYVKKNRKLG